MFQAVLCSCGLKHELKIEAFPYSDDLFKREVPWGKLGFEIFGEDFNGTILLGCLGAQTIAYAFYEDILETSCDLCYVQIKLEYQNKGYAREIICHILATVGRKRDIYALDTSGVAAHLLARAGFYTPEQALKMGQKEKGRWFYPKGTPLVGACRPV